MTGEIWIDLLIFAVAVLYSSVGHGGASGYLAVLALASVPHRTASTLALLMNLFVAGIALVQFVRGSHFRWTLVWPFLVGSVPLAILGGALRTSDRVYEWLLGAVLCVAALRFLIRFPVVERSETVPPPVPAATACGAGIGLISGIVGVGGGIFLSPIMLFAKWADAKRTSATSACFIVANSLAGLVGKGIQAPLDLHVAWPMLAAGVGGAALGSTLGSRTLPNVAIQRVLGIVLLIAATKAVVAP